MKNIKCFFILSALFFTFVSSCFASTKLLRPIVTVINPIRYPQLQKDKGNQLASLKDQWQVTSDAGINATWLWQYSTLEDKKLTDFAKSKMQGQEFGLFLEIDRNFADKAHVQYRGQGPWYFSDGLLLVSYDLAEREKLIDTAFAKFKSVFGYYPKTAGAWWVGVDSIDYMQKKYGIVASLKASDQFDLDAYSVWGTPWSIPYVSSKEDAGIPAKSSRDSSNVVMLQWAARDPLRGYKDSLYSLQDYTAKGETNDYFEYLVDAYLKQPLDQVVVGLEDDFPAGVYQFGYKDRLELVSKWEKSGKVNVLTAQDYAKEFLAKKAVIAPTNYFLTKDFNGSDQSFWFNGTNFRAAIEKINNKIFLFDLRNYANRESEDFSALPNSQGFLRVSEPAIIDSIRFPSQKLEIGESGDSLLIKKNSDGVELYAGNKQIAFFTPTKLQLFDLNARIYDFSEVNKFGGIFWLFLSAFIIYLLFVFHKTANFTKVLSQAILLMIPLLLAYPFLNLAQGFIFDRKELVFFFLPVVQGISLTLWITLVFQIIPFVLLLLIHFIFYVRSKNNRFRPIYYIYLGLLVFFYAHVLYFPLDRSTYATVFEILFGVVIALSVLIIAVVYKKRSIKTFFTSIFFAFLFLSLLVVLIFFSRQKFIITPFEMDALNVVANNHKNVLFIYPDSKPIYKAVRPLLYDYTQIGGELTGVSWQKITRDKQSLIKLTDLSNRLILVPRYLGADLSTAEIKDNNLIKIFDNSQIAIFEKQ